MHFINNRYILSADRKSTTFKSAKTYPAALGENGRTGNIVPVGKTGLHPVSHPDPLIVAPDNGRMCIEMGSER